MTNPYYDATGTPATGSLGSSQPMRSEFAAIQAGFDKLPDFTQNPATLALALIALGFKTGSFNNPSPTANTWYTAIANTVFASVNGPGMYLLGVFCENATAAIYVFSVPTTVGPIVITLTPLVAGTFCSAQIDGSGNLQVQATVNSFPLNAIWLRVPL